MVGYRRRNDGHDTPAIIESMIRIFRCARRISKRAEVGRKGMRVLLGFERERNGSNAERMLDCRVGVSATVNDGLCRRLYIGPCESQALIHQRDNGIPIMVFRLPPRGVEWAREEKPFVCFQFYVRERPDSKLELKQIARPSFPQTLLLLSAFNLVFQLFLLVSLEIFLNFFPSISIDRVSSIFYFMCLELIFPRKRNEKEFRDFEIRKLFANIVEMYNLFTFLKKEVRKKTIKLEIHRDLVYLLPVFYILVLHCEK